MADKKKKEKEKKEQKYWELQSKAALARHKRNSKFGKESKDWQDFHVAEAMKPSERKKTRNYRGMTHFGRKGESYTKSDLNLHDKGEIAAIHGIKRSDVNFTVDTEKARKRVLKLKKKEYMEKQKKKTDSEKFYPKKEKKKGN